ncbi:MAG: FtsX-like permease family protein [Acidobacteriota bacterium]
MKSFFLLFHRYILRDLIRKPARGVLTITGVALGIAVVVAVHLSSRQAVGSFTESLRVMSGQSDFQILPNGGPLDEQLVQRLSWLWDFGAMSALVEGRVALPDGSSAHVYGVDLLGDTPFRQYVSSDGRSLYSSISQAEFLELLLNPRTIILPERLARRLHVAKGSSLQLLIGDRRVNLVVGALLGDSGVARAFAGNVAFMDIAGAQLAFDKLGAVDRIDVLIREGEPSEIGRRIRAQLPATATLHRPRDLRQQGEKMLRAFRFNLAALSSLSLIVGVILVYNTLNIAVVRRQTEIAALRALGSRRSTIASLFLLEALGLGLLGAGLGIPAGELLSKWAGVLVSRTIETLYTGVPSHSSPPGTGDFFYLKMLVLGAALGAFSGVFPALRAVAASPVTVLRRAFLVSAGEHQSPHQSRLGVLLLAAGVGLCWAPPVDGLPLWGYGAALCFILGTALLGPGLGRRLLGAIESLSFNTLPIEVRLALQTVQGGLMRLAVAVLSLMIAVAMLVSVATLVGSFRETVVVWVDQTLRADLYVKAAGAGHNDWESPIDPGTVEALRHLPGIAALGRFRGRTIDYEGDRVTLAGGDFDVLAKYGKLLFLEGRKTALVASQLMNGDRVVVTEPLSIKHGIRPGDRIRLPTPQGMHPFEVEAVYYDYSSERGVIVMDRHAYLKYFSDPTATSLSLYLESGESPQAMRQRIASSLPGVELQIFSNGDLKREALRVFDQTFQVTYGLEAIALIVAVLGVTNTLGALILERRSEIALLRFLGADRRQIRRMTLVESALVGMMGCLLGFLLGLALSLVLIYVINRQSFGWTIQFDLPGGFLLLALSLVFVSTLMSGLYPAAMAVRTDPLRSLRTE